MIGVEARIDEESGIKDVVIEIAHKILRCGVGCIERPRWRWEGTGRRVLEIGIEIVCVVAHGVRATPHVSDEA